MKAEKNIKAFHLFGFVILFLIESNCYAAFCEQGELTEEAQLKLIDWQDRQDQCRYLVRYRDENLINDWEKASDQYGKQYLRSSELTKDLEAQLHELHSTWEYKLGSSGLSPIPSAVQLLNNIVGNIASIVEKTGSFCGVTKGTKAVATNAHVMYEMLKSGKSIYEISKEGYLKALEVAAEACIASRHPAGGYLILTKDFVVDSYKLIKTPEDAEKYLNTIDEESKKIINMINRADVELKLKKQRLEFLYRFQSAVVEYCERPTFSDSDCIDYGDMLSRLNERRSDIDSMRSDAGERAGSINEEFNKEAMMLMIDSLKELNSKLQSIESHEESRQEPLQQVEPSSSSKDYCENKTADTPGCYCFFNPDDKSACWR